MILNFVIELIPLVIEIYMNETIHVVLQIEEDEGDIVQIDLIKFGTFRSPLGEDVPPFDRRREPVHEREYEKDRESPPSKRRRREDERFIILTFPS